MIIETSDNRFYRVIETNSHDLAHLWSGLELKRVRNGAGFCFIPKTTRAGTENWTYVRKAASRVVEA